MNSLSSNADSYSLFYVFQSKLGCVALTVAILHTLMFGWGRAFDKTQYRFYLPPTFVLVLILPCAVLVARLSLALPCVSHRLERIRRGWEVDPRVHFQQQECHSSLEGVSTV